MGRGNVFINIYVLRIPSNGSPPTSSTVRFSVLVFDDNPLLSEPPNPIYSDHVSGEIPVGHYGSGL